MTFWRSTQNASVATGTVQAVDIFLFIAYINNGRAFIDVGAVKSVSRPPRAAEASTILASGQWIATILVLALSSLRSLLADDNLEENGFGTLGHVKQRLSRPPP